MMHVRILVGLISRSVRGKKMVLRSARAIISSSSATMQKFNENHAELGNTLDSFDLDKGNFVIQIKFRRC